MKKSVILMAALIALTGCRKSLEDRCEQEVREYTEKNCPAQISENMIVDSLTFDRHTHTLHYYYSVMGSIDDDIVMEELFHAKAQYFVLRTDKSIDSVRLKQLLSDFHPYYFEQQHDTVKFLADKEKKEQVERRLMQQKIILAKANWNDSDGRETLLQTIKNSTNLKIYKDKGYNFAYTYRSEKNPGKTYFSVEFTEKDY